MRNNKTLVMALMLVLTIIILGSGATYAYFQASISGNETTSTITVTGGTISIAYSNGTSISASNKVPGWSDTKYFTVAVTNNTGKAIAYNVNLAISKNTFTTAGSRLTYQLSTCSSSQTTCTTSVVSATEITATSGSVTVYTKSSITSSTTTYYALTLVFPNNTAAAQVQGCSFAGYVTVSSSSTVSQ